ncbi:MAG: AAA family ATPase, partial [Candidatus Binatia bacterium]
MRRHDVPRATHRGRGRGRKRVRRERTTHLASGSQFVGRERELEQLLAGFASALGGSGRLFLISGEAGIGKSRLVEEFSREAESAGARVYRAFAWQGAEDPAYWVWTQLVRERLGEPGAARLRLSRSDRALLGRLLLGTGGNRRGAKAPAHPVVESDEARSYLFDAIARFWEQAARRRPTVLVLEDLHAADPSSLRLLEFLDANLFRARLLVIGTLRDIGERTVPAAAEALEALLRQAEHLPLEGLSEPQVRELVARSFGVEAATCHAPEL